MLNKVIINNVLSHKKTIIDLVDGVNVITGITDAGKSAILCAVYWVLYNRPSADGLRSHWGGDSSVELHFTDGIITRLKSKTENVYILNGEKMLAGRNVPEPVQNFLNCSDINFQDQFAPAFMLDWLPAERGLFLNKITNLQIIDNTINNIKKTIRTENSLISSYELQLEDFKAEIKQYRGLDDLEDIVTALEDNQADIQLYDRKIDSLNDLVDKITGLDESIAKNNKKLLLKEKIQEIESDYNNLVKYRNKYAVLLELKKAVDLCNTGIEKQKKIIKQKKKEFDKLMPDNCPLCNKRSV